MKWLTTTRAREVGLATADIAILTTEQLEALLAFSRRNNEPVVLEYTWNEQGGTHLYAKARRNQSHVHISRRGNTVYVEWEDPLT